MPCMPKLMICCTRPRTLKKKLRRQWLTQQGLLMNLEQNKNMLHPKKRLNELWIAKLSNFKENWKKQMTLLLKEAVLQWPNSKQELENWKWNWVLLNAEHPTLTKGSKNLKERSKNCNSNKMKSRRIKKG